MQYGVPGVFFQSPRFSRGRRKRGQPDRAIPFCPCVAASAGLSVRDAPGQPL
ncbi:hypothetical protein SACS_1378 [Parasaccharibacter apium]|uniref:Uncharacterized protein n=1 Tax=Parasaccharibacter apium TaxID=1510841 RepID=A0A7U7J1E6_9PROT|nr:hypothetical protein SACS_1378 [Parasaccharibacter apium]